jgi:hypothetical protein
MRSPARVIAGLLPVLIAAAFLGGARAQPRGLPSTPAALRKFEGSLTGEVSGVRHGPQFTGLILTIVAVDPAPGSPPVDLRKVSGVRVAIAVPADRSGAPRAPEMAAALRGLAVHALARVDVRATGPEHHLYARQVTSAGPAPAVPGRTASVPGAPAGEPDLQQMNADLQTLRRDLARLQQDVAELKAITQDLAGRQKSGPTPFRR